MGIAGVQYPFPLKAHSAVAYGAWWHRCVRYGCCNCMQDTTVYGAEALSIENAYSLKHFLNDIRLNIFVFRPF